MVLVSFILDIILVNLAELCGFLTRFGMPLPENEIIHYRSLWFLMTLIRIWALYSNKVYDRRVRSFLSLSSSIIQASVISTVFIVAITFFNRTLAYPRLVILFSLIYTVLFLLIKHYLFWKFILVVKNRKRVLIIGATETGKRLINESQMFKHNFWDLIGFLDDKGSINKKVIGSYKLLGRLNNLKEVVKKYKIDLVIIAFLNVTIENKLKIIGECENIGVEYFIIPNFYEIVTGKAKLDQFEDLPILEPSRQPLTLMNRIFKRFFDIIFSIVFIIISLPVLIILSILIKINSGGEVIYMQLRAGKYGKPFYMYKFRTMVEDADRIGPKITDKNDKRVTSIGRFLRRWSLDELPQFINVLKGDMNIVGPRPEVVEIVKKYKSWQRKVLDVKPGITGYAQISGRQDLDIESKLQMDVYYVNNYSFILDLEIIFKTVITVIGGKGVY